MDNVLITQAFTPYKLREYLIMYLGSRIGTLTYSTDSQTVSDYAITVGNEVQNDTKIRGIEINIPLFPNSEELSLIDAHTATYSHYWELHVFLWDNDDNERIKLYELLHVMLGMLSNVKIFCSTGGLSRGFDYSEHYIVTFTQTCTGDKMRLE